MPSSTQVQRTTETHPTQPMAQAPPPVRLVLVAAATLLNADRQVLLAQRPPGKDLAGLWEFPGGKVRPAVAKCEPGAQQPRACKLKKSE